MHPEETAGVSDDSHTNQNSGNKTNHCHPTLPPFPSEEDETNRFGNEISKLTEEQAAAELEGNRAECLAESQTAGQPELSSVSENSESPLSSPSPSDSIEPPNPESKQIHENQALEEDKESSESDSEAGGDEKDKYGGLPVTKGNELSLSTPGLSDVQDHPHHAARSCSPDLNKL